MTKSLDKNYKVKVTPEQSEKLQLALFKHGFTWFCRDAKVSSTDKPYLFLENKILTWADNKNYFNSQNIEEITYEELMHLANIFSDEFQAECEKCHFAGGNSQTKVDRMFRELTQMYLEELNK